MTANSANGGNASSHAKTPTTDAALRTVERFAAGERLFRRLNHLLIAVSGGPDSLALLLLAERLAERHGFALTVAHFDHKLRPGSRDDLEFVKALAAERALECITGEGDPEQIRNSKRGAEDAARTMRYQFLAFVAGNERADRIATGHTADDQVETIVQRIVRGSGVRGIRGMLPTSPVPGASAQQLIRPLLPITRAETLAICAEAGLEPRIDESNSSDSHQRNRVRHQLIPALRKENPALARGILGLAESARQAFEPIERAALETQPAERTAFGSVFAAATLDTLPVEALSLVIEREAGFHQLEPRLNRTALRSLAALLPSRAGLVRFGDLEAEVSVGRVRLGPHRERPTTIEPTILNVPGATRAGDLLVQISSSPPANSPPAVAAIDRRCAESVLRIRSPRPGDRVEHNGRTRRLERLFGDLRIPRWERDGILTVTAGETIVALLGAPEALRPPPIEGESLYIWTAPLSQRTPP